MVNMSRHLPLHLLLLAILAVHGCSQVVEQEVLLELEEPFKQEIREGASETEGIQAVLANSQDFHIYPDEIYPQMINVVGISSPGLTAALAIARMVSNLVN